MEVSRGNKRLLEEANTEPKVCPTDNDAIAATSRVPTKHLDKNSLDYVLRSGIAGGLAGCAAKTVVGPLDRVKILFQASNPQFAKYTGSWFGVATAIRDINQTDGLRGLFRGHSATLLRVFPYAGIKFLAYEQYRAIFIPSRDKETWIRRFASGASAGITSVFFTYPLEVIRVRLAFETKKDSRSSLTRICKQIYHEHPIIPPSSSTATEVIKQVAPRSGLVNFYRGFSTTMIGMIPYAGVSFLTHDTIGDLLRRPFISKFTVIASTVPTSTEETRPSQKPRRTQLNAPAELTSGALAGLVSQTASYPLEVIRRHMQVGGAVGDGHRLRMAEVAVRIWRERGWRGYFVGLTIGYLKVIPMSATSFFAYERLKWWLSIES
ncbi:MAG: hypothetical protein Q9160_006715 [Pyrenula sp. 1 TL-2023]